MSDTKRSVRKRRGGAWQARSLRPAPAAHAETDDRHLAPARVTAGYETRRDLLMGYAVKREIVVP